VQISAVSTPVGVAGHGPMAERAPSHVFHWNSIPQHDLIGFSA
jgi:hypothetical protein